MREDYQGIKEDTSDLPNFYKGSTIYRIHLSINPHLCNKKTACEEQAV